ncbi:hypothetical protein H1C71_032875 [Ictidomys tridecemlineatus]|nr:hypothetical protein H1C71_032875 [Ictidomys tridecemlineatus]
MSLSKKPVSRPADLEGLATLAHQTALTAAWYFLADQFTNGLLPPPEQGPCLSCSPGHSGAWILGSVSACGRDIDCYGPGRLEPPSPRRKPSLERLRPGSSRDTWQDHEGTSVHHAPVTTPYATQGDCHPHGSGVTSGG